MKKSNLTKIIFVVCLMVLMVACEIEADSDQSPANPLISSPEQPNSDLNAMATETEIPAQPTGIDNLQLTPMISITFEITNAASNDNTPKNLTPPAQITANLQKLINLAKENLAGRLSVSLSQISLAAAEEALWPDSSLGCPQKGISYLQVQTPGYRIVLEHGGKVYEYHTDQSATVVLCNFLEGFEAPIILATPDE